MSPDVLRLILAVMLTAMLGGCDYVMPPKTYEDCIIRHIKPGMNDGAVRLVSDACFDKFIK